MSQSSWILYLDDFPNFWFLSSSSRTRARAGGHIILCPFVHVKLQEGCNLTSKYSKNSQFGVETVKIRVL